MGSMHERGQGSLATNPLMKKGFTIPLPLSRKEEEETLCICHLTGLTRLVNQISMPTPDETSKPNPRGENFPTAPRTAAARHHSRPFSLISAG